MISDLGVSVEAGPRVHVELPVSGVEHVGDVVSLECPLVFGCVPEGGEKTHNYLSSAD